MNFLARIVVGTLVLLALVLIGIRLTSLPIA